MINYNKKYLKYKLKYLQIKGGAEEITPPSNELYLAVLKNESLLNEILSNFSFLEIDTSKVLMDVKNRIALWEFCSNLHFLLTKTDRTLTKHNPAAYPNLLYVFDDKATYVALSINESLKAKFNAIKCLKLNFNEELEGLKYPKGLIILIFGDEFNMPICYEDKSGNKEASTTCESYINGTTLDNVHLDVEYKSVFPKSLNKLKYLYFGESFNNPLGKLMTDIRQTYHTGLELLVQTYLPSNIEVLHLGTSFTRPTGHYIGSGTSGNIQIISLLPPKIKLLYIEGTLPRNNTNIFKGMIQLYSSNSVEKKIEFKKNFFADFKYLVYKNIDIEEIGHEYGLFDNPILKISNTDDNMVISNNRDKLLQAIEDRRQLHINYAINPPRQPLTFAPLPRVGDQAALPPPPPSALARGSNRD